MNKAKNTQSKTLKLNKLVPLYIFLCTGFSHAHLCAQPVFYAVNSEICSSGTESQVAFFALASRPIDTFGELTINFGDNTTRKETLFLSPAKFILHTYNAPLQSSYRVTATWRPRNSNQDIPMFDFILPVVACSQPLQRQFAFPNAFGSFGHASTVDSNNNLWLAGDGLDGQPVTPRSYKSIMTPQGWFSNDSRVIKFCGISGVIDCATFIGGGERNTGDPLNNDRFKAEDIISIVPGLEGEVYVSGMTSDPNTIPPQFLLGGSRYNGNRPDGTFTRNTFVARFDGRCQLQWGTFLGNSLHNNAGRITISPDGNFLYVLLDTNVNQEGRPLTISDGSTRFRANIPGTAGHRGAIARIDARNGRVTNIGYYQTGDNDWYVNAHGDAVVYFPVIQDSLQEMVLVASNPNLDLQRTLPRNNSQIILTGFAPNNLNKIGVMLLGRLTKMPSLAVIPLGNNLTALYVSGELRRGGGIHNQINTQRDSDVFLTRLINTQRTPQNPLGLFFNISRSNLAPGNHYAPQIVRFTAPNRTTGLYLSTFTDQPSGVTQSNAFRPLFSYLPYRLDRTLVRLSPNLTPTSSRTYVAAGLSNERNILNYDWANLSVTQEGNVVVMNNSIPDSDPLRSGSPQTISLPYVTPEYLYKITPPYVNDVRLSPNLPGWNETLVSVFGEFSNSRPNVPVRRVIVEREPCEDDAPMKKDYESGHIGNPAGGHRVTVCCENGTAVLQLHEFCGIWECHHTIEVQDRYTGQWQAVADYPAWAQDQQQRPRTENMIFPVRRGLQNYRLVTRCPFVEPGSPGNPDEFNFSIECCDRRRSQQTYEHRLERLCLDESAEIRLTENYTDQSNISWRLVSGDATLTPSEDNRSAFVTGRSPGEVTVSVTYTDSCHNQHTETFRLLFLTRVQNTSRSIDISVCPGIDLTLGSQLPIETPESSTWTIDRRFTSLGGRAETASPDGSLLSLSTSRIHYAMTTFTFTRTTVDGCNTFTDVFKVTVQGKDFNFGNNVKSYNCTGGDNPRTCFSFDPSYSIESILAVTDLSQRDNPRVISPDDYIVTIDSDTPGVLCITWLNRNVIPEGLFDIDLRYTHERCNYQGTQNIPVFYRYNIPDNLPPRAVSSCGNVFIPDSYTIFSSYSVDLSGIPSDLNPVITRTDTGFFFSTPNIANNTLGAILIVYDTPCGPRTQIVNLNFISIQVTIPDRILTCGNRVCFSVNRDFAVEEIATANNLIEDYTYSVQDNMATYCLDWTKDDATENQVIGLSLVNRLCPDSALHHTITVVRVPGPLSKFDAHTLEACINSPTTLNLPDNGANYTLSSESEGLSISQSSDNSFTIYPGTAVGTHTLRLTAKNDVCEESRTITLVVRQCCDPVFVRSNVIFREGCFQSLSFDVTVGSQPRRGVEIAWLARLNETTNQIQLLDRTLCPGICVELEELRQQYHPPMIWQNGRLVPNPRAGQPTGEPTWVNTGVFANGNQKDIHFTGDGLTDPNTRAIGIRLKFKPNGCDNENGSFYSEVFYPSYAPCNENTVIGGGGVVINPDVLP